MRRGHRSMIGGAGRKPHTSRNPATGAWLKSYTLADDAAIEKQLTAASIAAAGWRTTTFGRRASVLKLIARVLRQRSEDLAILITSEMGKPIREARAEVEKCAAACEFYAEHGESMLQPLRIAGQHTDDTVHYRPLGTILAIMPWNFPLWQVFRFAVPAIMAGNTGLLKHAPITSGCALAIEEVMREADLPAGAFSALLIEDAQSETLIADPRIAAVTLTGSERAGAAVGALAGKHIKKCVMELGGSDPFIVFRDADIATAVKTAITARFQNSGQSCIAAKRFLIDASVYDEFMQAFTAGVRALVVGNPRDEDTQIGPLARRDLRDTVASQVKQTVTQGAAIVCGGESMPGSGFYFEPTILENVAPPMTAAVEEVFGPVAACLRVRDIEEAIAVANATRYGLGASVWTKDLDAAKRLASRLEFGSVTINAMTASDPRMPFGGVKHSGYGRELGAFGMLEFMNVQSVGVA